MSETTVATLAPHVDRLAICIHRPAGADPALRAAIGALAIPAGSMLVVAARYLVRDGLRPGDLAALSRYRPPSWHDASTLQHVEQGLLIEGTDGVFRGSPAFRDAAQVVLRAQADAATALWMDNVDVADAATVADELVTRARTDHHDNDDFPAFRRQVETRPDVAATGPAPLLLAAITELRYLRADAHAAALAQAGVRPKDAAELTKRWKGFGEPLPPHDADTRTAIEEETNRRVVDALDPTRADQFLALVEHLPGDDPRPLEDR